VKDTVLSVAEAEGFTVKEIPFTEHTKTFVDARYVHTTVNHEFCTSIPPVVVIIPTLVTPFHTSLVTSVVEDRAIIKLLFGAPLPRSIILSHATAVPVKRTTATAVKPPLVAMLSVREPASRY
jgi:hypothetical protein